MLRSMYSGISGMKVNQSKLDVIGNNIANVSTTAFKASTTTFKDMIYQNSTSASAASSVKGGLNAKQVGLGSQLASINKVMGQGNLISTSRALDVAIDGDGYLIVGSGTTKYGADDGTEGGNKVQDNTLSTGDQDILYTRDGNLTLDSQGNLLTSDGYRVLGYYLTSGGDNASSITGVEDANGIIRPQANYVDPDGDLKAVGDDGGTLQPLVIPDQVYLTAGDETTLQAVRSYSIGSDGVIIAILANGKTTALGQIALGSFKNPEGLELVGSNKLQVSANSGNVLIKTPTGTEDGDNSNGFGSLVQGTLEGSNVDLTEQFTDMITATRAFQASSKMISTGDEILQTITGLI